MKRGSEVDQIAVLYTTWPDAETAERAAEAAVGSGLAACVNILGAGRSIFRWQGKIECADETVALFKTSTAKAEILTQLIIERHPYDVPAILALNIEIVGSNPAFLAWILERSR